MIKDIEKAFGMKANEPMIFRSKMSMRRVIEAPSAGNIVLKTLVRNRKSQQFFFDPIAKTIKSQ